MGNTNSGKAELSGQTFIIDIKDRRNSTWQGTVQWIQTKKCESFRSTLELLHLLDSAITMTDEQAEWDK